MTYSVLYSISACFWSPYIPEFFKTGWTTWWLIVLSSSYWGICFLQPRPWAWNSCHRLPCCQFLLAQTRGGGSFEGWWGARNSGKGFAGGQDLRCLTSGWNGPRHLAWCQNQSGGAECLPIHRWRSRRCCWRPGWLPARPCWRRWCCWQAARWHAGTWVHQRMAQTCGPGLCRTQRVQRCCCELLTHGASLGSPLTSRSHHRGSERRTSALCSGASR